MARTTALKVDVRQLEAFAGDLNDLTDAERGKTAVVALNEVIDRTYDLARTRINAGINLADDYVRRKMSVDHATVSRPVATITAPGDKSANVPLRNYDAKMVLVPSKRPGNTQGPRRLPIPFGMRQRAVEVQVTRGSPQSLTHGFMLPLRNGTQAGGNGLGVFTRSRDGKVRHRYGPAVYQLFSHQINDTPFTSEVQEDLEDTLVAYAEAELQKALK